MKNRFIFLLLVIALSTFVEVFSYENSSSNFNDYFNYYNSINDLFYSYDNEELNIFIFTSLNNNLIEYYSILFNNLTLEKNNFDLFLGSNLLNLNLAFSRLDIKDSNKMISISSINNLSSKINVIFNFRIDLNELFLKNKINIQDNKLNNFSLEYSKFMISEFFNDITFFKAKEPDFPIILDFEDFVELNISRNTYYRLLTKENIFIRNLFEYKDEPFFGLLNI